MKHRSMGAISASVVMLLSGCSLFSQRNENPYKDTIPGKPSQVRYTGVEKVTSQPSRVVEPTTDKQYVLQPKKPIYKDAGLVVAKPAPVIAQAAAREIKQVILPQATAEHGRIQVNFKFDSDKLAAEAKESLRSKLDTLKSATDIVIIGHTDSLGPDSYNMMLSLRRGEAVRSFLEKNGVAREKMQIKGEGEKSPASNNGSSAGRSQNRRVVITY